MKIKQIIGREIFDSRGLPTVACDLYLDNGAAVSSAIPSGLSCGVHEALELRDGGDRFMGQGVLKAVHNIQEVIAPHFLNKEPDLIAMDLKMIELDGTDNKENLGANATLAVSIALLKAQALTHELEPFEMIAHLCSESAVSLPFPLFNIVNGGKHAQNNLKVQEIMLMPIGAQNFREAMEIAVDIFHVMKKLLKENDKRTFIGDEGGFDVDFADEVEALEYVTEAINQVTGDGNNCVIALDVAASEFYDKKTGTYAFADDNLSAEQMVKLLKKLTDEFPIYSIEDGLSEDDWGGWLLLMKELGEKVQIVGDDLFTTNPYRIARGIEEGAANSTLIKPNQIGTITQTLQAIKLCKEHGMNMIASHRSGETEDTFIVDLAVGACTGQIKAGGILRGERIAKYNRLLQIEDMLAMSLLSS